jgi:CHAP domain
VSLDSVMARIAEINTAFVPPAQTPATSSTSTSSTSSFASALQSATATAATATSPYAATGNTVGARMVAIAQGEVGQAEQPPGSNDSPRIAQYRSATAGNPGVGPWCAYFVSWAARQAGAPLGNVGQGFGSVDQLWSWAQSSGRAYQGTQQQPQPGDLIVFHEHVGMVESVLPDGRIQTIEGNSSDQVSRRIHAPGDAVGYVRVG